MANDWWGKIVKDTIGDFISGAAGQAGSEAVTRGVALLLDDSPEGPPRGDDPGGEITSGDHTRQLRDAAMLDFQAALLRLALAKLKSQGYRTILDSGSGHYEGETRGGDVPPHGLGVPHGLGTYFDDDCSYVGEWRDGVPHGSGVFKNMDVRYAGEWRNSEPHGHGFFVSSNGRS